MSKPDRRSEFSPRTALLDAALEDQAQGRRAPDLSASILAAARRETGAADSPRGPSRWLIAALLLLGLSIVPAIRWLQERDAAADRAVTAPQDPDRGPQAEEPVVVPENPQDLLELVRGGVRGIRARVPAVDTLIVDLGGHDPAPFVPMLGDGARTDFLWGRWEPEQSAPLFDSLLGILQAGGAWIEGGTNPQASVHRELDLRLDLEGSPRRALSLRLWISTPSPAGDHWVWIRTRSGDVASRDQALARDLLALRGLTERTIQSELGIYKGNTLTQEPAAKRSERLRLHRTSPQQLRALGGSAVCRELDVRFSKDLLSVDGARAIVASFPNLRRLVLGPGMSEPAVAELTALEPLEELVFCDPNEDPDGPVEEPAARGLGAGTRDLFTRFSKLRVLVIPGGLVDDEHLPRLPQTLERLTMPYAAIDGAGFVGMAEHARLERVELKRCPSLTDRAFEALADLPSLRVLDVRNAVANGGLQDESGIAPFANNTAITPASLRALARCSNLETLHLDNWFRNDMAGPPGAERELVAEGWIEALDKVAHLPGLRVLSLRDGWCVEIEHLAGVRSAPNLRTLDLTGCNRLLVGDLVELQEAMPWCEVVHPRLVRSALEMRPVAVQPEDGEVWFELADEQDRLLAWLDAHADEVKRDPVAAIDAFHALLPAEGGPLAGERLRWYPRPFGPDRNNAARWEPSYAQFVKGVVAPVDEAHLQPRPLAPPGKGGESQVPAPPVEWVPVDMGDECFTGHDLAAASISEDDQGRLALEYELLEPRKAAYGNWTERLTGRFSVVLVAGRVLEVPKFVDAIRGGRGRLSGISKAEAERIIHEVSRR